MPQSTISAYERDARQPTLPQLERFLKAAGFQLRMHLSPYDDHDDILAQWEERLTPEQKTSVEAEMQAALAAGQRRRT